MLVYLLLYGACCRWLIPHQVRSVRKEYIPASKYVLWNGYKYRKCKEGQAESTDPERIQKEICFQVFSCLPHSLSSDASPLESWSMYYFSVLIKDRFQILAIFWHAIRERTVYPYCLSGMYHLFCSHINWLFFFIFFFLQATQNLSCKWWSDRKCTSMKHTNEVFWVSDMRYEIK